MSDLHDRIHQLHRVAEETDQVASAWRVGRVAFAELRHRFQRDGNIVRQVHCGNFEMMGLPIVEDGDLPDTRITLMAWRNTIGAFDIAQEALGE